MAPVGAIAAGMLVIALAAFVLAVRPGSRLHRALAALLIMRSATTIAYAAMLRAPDEASALGYAHLVVWYALPVPLALALAARAVLAPRDGVGIALVAGAGAMTVAGLATMAVSPELFIDGVESSGAAWFSRSGAALYLLTGIDALAAGAVALALVARERVGVGATARAWIAIGIVLSIVYVAAHLAVVGLAPAAPSPSALLIARIALTLVGAAAALVATARALPSVGPRARAVAVAGIGAALALGVLDGALTATQVGPSVVAASSSWYRFVPGYDTSVVLVRTASALVIALAALRYGLADAGPPAHRAAVQGARVAMSAAAGVALAGVVALLVGTNAVGLSAGALALAATPLLAWPLTREPARRMARALLLPLDDPRAVAERARRYAAALAVARGADGRVSAEGESLLRSLRAELGISDQEHELLVRGIDSRAPSPGATLGRYRLERALGAGAAGAASLAVDVETGTRVVVKRYHAGGAAQSALAEARAMMSVRHPRVLSLLDIDRRGDEVFVVSPYIEGGAAIDRAPLAPREAVGIALDALEGLDALHCHGLVHRDVKPENILVDVDGRGVLADLGSARFSAELDVDSTGVGGSLATVAPEILRRAPATPASDLYAVGATLYRLLAGAHYVALEGADAFEARERILLDDPRLPHARIPAVLEPALRRALAKAAAERPPTARAMADEMRAALRVLEDEQRAPHRDDVAGAQGAGLPG